MSFSSSNRLYRKPHSRSSQRSRALLLLISLPLALIYAFSAGAFAEPSKVSIEKINNQYLLKVNDSPFMVKGVGLGFQNEEQVRALKQAGGNSFRTWSTENLETELALAEELNLMIAVGIRTGKELQGFDYNDKKAVAAQFENVKSIIDKYKTHPNVLCWVIANEPNLLFDEQGKLKDVNPKVYKALGDITEYIHETDPNHPVTFTFAGAIRSHIETALANAPSIDFISVQLYGDLATLGETITQLNIDKPFMVTEFGPQGHWERPFTEWNREIEEPSAPKAQGMAERMETAILNDQTGKVIGSFAFLWGQKQERTPTWYGMFNASGERTARIDELTRIWTGQYPANRAPLSSAITINTLPPEASLKLAPNTVAKAKLNVTDPDGDQLKTEWYLMEEVGVRSQGGHHEDKPQTLPVIIKNTNINVDDGYVEIEFITPKRSGEYRLFSYTYDGHNNVANANFPFLVTANKK